MRPPSILRTKHSPRWPSCSLQSRGQRSHCTRPSLSACHQRPGYEVAVASSAIATAFLFVPALRFFLLLPLRHAIAGDLAARKAGVGRQARLLDQLQQKELRVRDALPYPRQESRALAAVLE